MNFAFSVILYTLGVIACYLALWFIRLKERKYTENKLLIAVCFGSAVWSIGFAALFLQTNPEYAYICRSIGMIGTFMYLITALVMVRYISRVGTFWRYLVDGYAMSGVLIYFLTVQRSETVYYMDTYGMTYYFKPGFANTVYTVYSALLGVITLLLTVYMIFFSKVKRIQTFGKYFLAVALLIVGGMVLDTVFPLLGMPAIPGSSILQFWGIVVLCRAVRANNCTRISIENMSGFIYSSLTEPVLVYDSGYHLQIINEGATEFLGIMQNDIHRHDTALAELFETEQPEAFGFEGSHKSIETVCRRNRMECNLAINRIFDHYGDVIGYIIIVTDLSERVKNLKKLEEAKREAEAASLAKSTFLANMSHEIRTPMNAIMGFSELILKMEIEEKVRDYVFDIKRSSQNLLAVINDILDISKLESGKMELAPVNYYAGDLLQDVFHVIDVQAKKKGLYFNFDTDPDIPHELYGDKTRIRAVLINLLNNAVKYTPEGGVTFRAKVLSKKADQAELQFIVSDTGIGIKKEVQEHLFESFAQFDREKNDGIEGTGLGLAIVNGYMQLMGGNIAVDSVYGEGTTFTVTVSQKVLDDRAMDAISMDSEKYAGALNTQGMKIRDVSVLAVDDNLINLKVISNTLQHYGMAVDTASGGEEAVAKCREKAYDIIFMDQMMPKMDGIEAMQHIRELSSHYAAGGPGKIIVLTANAISGVPQELVRKGFDEYLSKPVDFKELDRVILRFVPEEKIVMEGAGNENISTLTEKLPGVDVAVGLENCGGDEKLYLEVLQIMYDTSSEQLECLKAYYTNKERQKYASHLCGIAGQLLCIGCTRLGEMAKALEYSAMEDMSDSDQKLEDFLEQYQKLLEHLKGVI